MNGKRRVRFLRAGAVAAVVAVLAGQLAPAYAGWGSRHAWGCWGHGFCAPSAPCQYETVETTVYVPRMVTETRTVKRVVYRHERREETVQVARCVPEVKTYTREYTVMVPREMTKTVTYTVQVPTWKEVEQEYTVMVPYTEERTAERMVCRPVWSEEERSYTVMVPHQEERTAERLVCRQVWNEEERSYTLMVPHQETRQGHRTVCQYVPSTETRYVCRDAGHWSTVNYANPCNPCCTWSQCVWVPNVVREAVEYKVMRPQVSTVPYEYTVTVYENRQTGRWPTGRHSAAFEKPRCPRPTELVGILESS